MRIGLSQAPDALAVQGAVAHTAVRKSLIPWTKDQGPLTKTVVNREARLEAFESGLCPK